MPAMPRARTRVRPRVHAARIASIARVATRVGITVCLKVKNVSVECDNADMRGIRVVHTFTIFEKQYGEPGIGAAQL